MREFRAHVPDGVAVVDLAGATLLPGLVDSAAHPASDASVDALCGLAGRDDDAVATATRCRVFASASGLDDGA